MNIEANHCVDGPVDKWQSSKYSKGRNIRFYNAEMAVTRRCMSKCLLNNILLGFRQPSLIMQYDDYACHKEAEGTFISQLFSPSCTRTISLRLVVDLLFSASWQRALGPDRLLKVWYYFVLHSALFLPTACALCTESAGLLAEPLWWICAEIVEILVRLPLGAIEGRIVHNGRWGVGCSCTESNCPLNCRVWCSALIWAQHVHPWIYW